jgi:hypothetical protein
MRLLESSTLQIKEFSNTSPPPYVILSHTWGSEELSFQDIQHSPVKVGKGFQKIQKCCTQAVRDGYQWVWIDTCCIDKTSSAELSEAINSMYKWYKDANVCYAYLDDVAGGVVFDEQAFKMSRWFTRGWTLQELIAPKFVEFYAADWTEIGTKCSLLKLIMDVTGIQGPVLRGNEPSTCNVAQRMSWGSQRVTTRPEDMAYCLMGLFDVNMPPLYGEGGPKAFIRLQEEIMRTTDDYTLFAWRYHRGENPEKYRQGRGMLAGSPADFCTPESCVDSDCKNTSKTPFSYRDLVLDSAKYSYLHSSLDNLLKSRPQESPVLTSRGFRISVAITAIQSQAYNSIVLAYLDCHTTQYDRLCIRLTQSYDHPSVYIRDFADGDGLALLPAGYYEKLKYSTIYVGLPETSRQFDSFQQVFSVKLASDCTVVEASWPPPMGPSLNNFYGVFFPDGRKTCATVLLSHRPKDYRTHKVYFAISLRFQHRQHWCVVRTDLEEPRVSDDKPRWAESLWKSFEEEDWEGEVEVKTDRVISQVSSGSWISVGIKVLPIPFGSVPHVALYVSCKGSSPLGSHSDCLE